MGERLMPQQQQFQEDIVAALGPYLYQKIQNWRTYVCLHIRNEAFTRHLPTQFNTDAIGWHIHIPYGSNRKGAEHHDTLLGILPYFQPNIAAALRPSLLRWKLEGGE